MSEKITFADKKRKTVEQAEFTEDGRYLRKVRSFVLRTGRLSDYQRDMMNNNWANLGLDYQSTPFNFQGIFGNDNPVILEIGFGMGRSLVEMAEQNPKLDANKMYRAKQVEVRTKDRNGIYAQLAKGVKAGDIIVTGGFQRLNNHSLIIVSDQEAVGVTVPAKSSKL